MQRIHCTTTVILNSNNKKAKKRYASDGTFHSFPMLQKMHQSAVIKVMSTFTLISTMFLVDIDAKFDNALIIISPTL